MEITKPLVHVTDVVIIGAGPVGLFSIFECGMLKLKCHVIDTLSSAGGQCAALYPEKPIYDIPAYPSILAGELVENLKKQADPFQPVYHFGQQVEKISPLSNGRFTVETSTGTQVNAGAIIIAAGVGAFGPNRPPLEGIQSYENRNDGTGIHYFITNREQFRGKKLVIAGGGDSAVDWAISLAEIAKHVTVVHRRAKFRAAPESMARLQALAEGPENLDLQIPYQLSGLKGQDQQLTGVEIKSLNGETKLIEADALLPFFGLAMNLGPIANWGLSLSKNHITVTPDTCETSIKGIFAIGDIASYPSKLKLILTGFAEAAHAAHGARSYLLPEDVFHFEYSTTQGIPSEN